MLETLWAFPEGIDRAILLAPLLEPANFGFTSFIARVVGVFTPAGPIPGPKPGYLCFEKMPFSWVAALGRWREKVKNRPPLHLPLLVVQGDADKNLDWKANVTMLGIVAPDAKVRLLPGRGHVLLDRGAAQAETLAAIREFLADSNAGK